MDTSIINIEKFDIFSQRDTVIFSLFFFFYKLITASLSAAIMEYTIMLQRWINISGIKSFFFNQLKI